MTRSEPRRKRERDAHKRNGHQKNRRERSTSAGRSSSNSSSRSRRSSTSRSRSSTSTSTSTSRGSRSESSRRNTRGTRSPSGSKRSAPSQSRISRPRFSSPGRDHRSTDKHHLTRDSGGKKGNKSYKDSAGELTPAQTKRTRRPSPSHSRSRSRCRTRERREHDRANDMSPARGSRSQGIAKRARSASSSPGQINSRGRGYRGKYARDRSWTKESERGGGEREKSRSPGRVGMHEGNSSKSRGRDAVLRRTGPEGERERYPPARSGASPDEPASKPRWRPSPSPTAPTASENLRRSQSYQAQRGRVESPSPPATASPNTNGRNVSHDTPITSRLAHASGRGEPQRRSTASSWSPSASPDARRRRRQRKLSRGESREREGKGQGSAAPRHSSAARDAAIDNGNSRESRNNGEMGEGKGRSPSPSPSARGENGKSKKGKKKQSKKEKKKTKKKKGERGGGKDHKERRDSTSPRRSDVDRGHLHDRADGRASRSEDQGRAPEPPVPGRSSKVGKPSSFTLPTAGEEKALEKGKDKTSSTGKRKKKPKLTATASLLSFEDEGGDAEGAEFQGLGEATLNEFKRSHKKDVAATAAAAAAAASATTVVDAVEEAPSVAAPLDFLLHERRNAVLGPAKISTAESRGAREYQEDRHTVVSCLHAPDDAHTKFDACPPCFLAVFDGHNGHLAADIAKSKLHTYLAKAAPTTGLRGEPKERLEGLLRAAFASTEAEILKETAVAEAEEEEREDAAKEKDATASEDGDSGDGSGSDGGGSGGTSVRQDGTTATACLLVGDLVVTANVGDTTAVLGSVGHQDKVRCRRLSRDHKPEDPSERRRIKAAGGDVVFNGCYRVQHENVSCRLAVSRSLGDRQFKGQGGQPPGSDVPPPPDMRGQLVSPEPSLNTVQLEPYDRVIIVASDGLWDVMTGLEAVEIAIAAHAKAPTTAGRAPSWANALANGTGGKNAEADPATALVKEAVKRSTADNVTAVVAVLSWD